MRNLQTRSLLKTAIGHTLWPLTHLLARRHVGGRRGLILTFHYIGDPILPGAADDLFLSRRVLAKVLDFVSSRLSPLPPLEFLDRLSEGTLPQSATMLTFDDCTRDAVTEALPELETRSLSACFFVCPALIERRRSVPSLELMDACARAPQGQHRIRMAGLVHESGMAEFAFNIGSAESRNAAFRTLWPVLFASPSSQHGPWLDSLRGQFGIDSTKQHSYPLASWNEIARLHDAGMWIGSHTMMHSTISADGARQFAADVAAAYESLDARYPSPRKLFCYPYGRPVDATEEASRILEREGTEFAFVTQGGRALPERDGLLRLRREDAAYSLGAAKLAPLLALVR
jgi:peptidoglycan/xylan/chitin deacetylase (PgdA/CDA1 family)